MSKKTNVIIGIVLVALFAVLLSCNWGNTAVFKLQKGEAEKAGVVFSEEEDLISLYDKYMEKGEYDKAIIVAKKMEGYHSLENAYFEAGKYEEALIVMDKLIEMGQPKDAYYIAHRAKILKLMGREDEAVKIFEEHCKEDKECLDFFIETISEETE